MEILNVTTVDPEPTLAETLRDLWLARVWLAAGAFFGIAAGLILLILAVPQYKASMVVAPTTHAGSPDISGLFPDNAGMAMEMMLQSFGPGDSADFMRFETIVTEPSVARLLAQDKRIQQGLARARRWRFLAAPDFKNPVQIAAWLQENLQVEPVGTTRLKRLVFRHPDPAFAVFLLHSVYEDADNLIRAELEDKTHKRIDYLEKLLDQTQNPDHRRTITKLLMDQEQVAMIVAVHEPYVASVAEPAAANIHADWPRKSVVLPASLLVGLVLGYIAYGFRRLRG